MPKKRTKPQAPRPAHSVAPRKTTAKAKKAAIAGTLKRTPQPSVKAQTSAKAKQDADANRAAAASRLSDKRIQSIGGWRAQMLADIRRMIHEADPEIVEERKWAKPTNPAGVPVWSHAGIVCTGEAYKEMVKLTFARGASLPDPSGLFNSSLEGNTRRAIDIRQGEVLDAKAFKALIRSAVAENLRRRNHSSAGQPLSHPGLAAAAATGRSGLTR